MAHPLACSWSSPESHSENIITQVRIPADPEASDESGTSHQLRAFPDLGRRVLSGHGFCGGQPDPLVLPVDKGSTVYSSNAACPSESPAPCMA